MHSQLVIILIGTQKNFLMQFYFLTQHVRYAILVSETKTSEERWKQRFYYNF